MKYCKYLMVLVAVTTSVVMMALDVNYFTFSHLGRSEGMHSQRIYDICQSNISSSGSTKLPMALC